MKSESTERILKSYDKCQSIKGVEKDTGYSWNRIVKTLSTSGIVVNETHYAILELHEKGKTCNEIAKILDMNERTVASYLPRVRPVYKENLSVNAQRIVKCREKKRGRL